MRIRLRLAFAYAAALALSLLVVGVVVWWQQGASIRAALQSRLAGELTDLLDTIEQTGAASVVEPDDKPDVVFVAVFDRDQQPIVAEPGTPADLGAPLPGPGISERQLGGVPYLLAVGRGADDTIAIVGASLEPVLDAQAILAQSVLIVGLIASGLSLAGGWWLAGRALAPVAALTAQAAEIGATDLGRRLPVPDHEDELSTLARTLNAMLDRIDGSVRRQRSFLAAASHDLRTPVAALQTELELADRDDAGLDELRGAVQAARGDAVRLGDLAADLLELVSAGSGGRDLVRATVDIRDIVQAVLRHLAPMAAERGVTLHGDVTEDLVSVDRVRMEQALRNVIANAITYSPRGATVEVSARVERGVAPAPGTLMVEVLDRGPGIAEAELERVLEPFGRGANARGPGSGLGLSTALSAVQAHGGSLVLTPRTGGGLAVRVRIPLR